MSDVPDELAIRVEIYVKYEGREVNDSSQRLRTLAGTETILARPVNTSLHFSVLGLVPIADRRSTCCSTYPLLRLCLALEQHEVQLDMISW